VTPIKCLNQQAGEVVAFIELMKNQSRTFEDSIVPLVAEAKVFDIDRVRPKRLTDLPCRVAIRQHWLERSTHGVSKSQKAKSLRSKEGIHVRKKWLAFIELNKLNFALDNACSRQHSGGILESHQLCALNDELHEIDGAKIDNIIQPSRLQAFPTNDLGELSKVVKQGKRLYVGLKQRRYHRQVGDVQRMAGSIANGIGQIPVGFGEATRGIQPFTLFCNRLKSNHLCEPSFGKENPWLLRRALNLEGSAVDTAKLSLKLEELKQQRGFQLTCRNVFKAARLIRVAHCTAKLLLAL
jgi:hypothetical protein